MLAFSSLRVYNKGMNQIKIGKFIAERRKAQNLTQKQLADLLFISEKTVSKWETGKGLPEISIMLSLCERLEISVNELLLGERIEEKEYKQTAEENLLKLIEENKRKYKLFVLCAILTIISVVSLITIASLVEMSPWARVILIGCAAFVGFRGIAATASLELEAGYYECPNCKHLFKPTMVEYVKGPHTLTRRQLKCPKCGAKKYCKYVFAAKVGDEVKRLEKPKKEE